MKKQTHQDVADAIDKFLKEGGKIKRTKSTDEEPIANKVEESRNLFIVDPTAYENPHGWRQH